MRGLRIIPVLRRATHYRLFGGLFGVGVCEQDKRVLVGWVVVLTVGGRYRVGIGGKWEMGNGFESEE